MNDQDNISEILNGCLELIQSDNATIGSLLEKYPESKEILRPPLEAAVWLQSRVVTFNPRPSFVFASKQRLVDRFRKHEINVIDVDGYSFGERFVAFTRLRVRYAYGILACLVVIILVISYNDFSVTIRHSLPGDSIYPVKLALEDVKLMISLNPEKDAEFRIEFLARRLAEIEQLLELGRTDSLDLALNNYEEQFGITLSTIEAVGEGDQRAFDALSFLLKGTVQENITSLSQSDFLTQGTINSEMYHTISVLMAEIDDLDSLGASLSTTLVPNLSPALNFTLALEGTPTATVFSSIPATETVDETVQAISTPTLETSSEAGADDGDEENLTPKAKKTHKPKPEKTEKPGKKGID
jgi:hypothetical protein